MWHHGLRFIIILLYKNSICFYKTNKVLQHKLHFYYVNKITNPNFSPYEFSFV